MMKKIIRTDNAPAPIGPYNQAVEAGGFVFVSGQIPLDTTTGQIITGDIKAETKKVMDNIGAVLTKAGLKFSDIVKTSIFLTDMQSFASVNEVYGSYFTDQFPARETIQVSALPKNVNIEISVIALKS
jgi:2-iminobutanoate/2-iminopropanoate deaminase